MFKGVLDSADMTMTDGGRRKIILTGTCRYELTGLWHLLSAQGDDVYCMSLEELNAPDGWGLVIVALSAEPVAGWGRNLPRIFKLKDEMSCEMVVLVPERLKGLQILEGVCRVYSGREGLQRLKSRFSLKSDRGAVQSGWFSLRPGQRRALKRLSERGRNSPLNLKVGERKLYYHHARLAEDVGVRNFSMLLMTGLDRELSRMENWRAE